MNVCVIGTGYVGLVTGACFAEFGVQVICADMDRAKIEALNQGRIPIYEPGLEDVVERNVKAGRLAFTTDTAQAVRSSLVVFIAVQTPPRPDGGTDLAAVENVDWMVLLAPAMAPAMNWSDPQLRSPITVR